MDNFTKIELIVKGKLKERKAELERCKKPEPNPYGANPLYILGIEHEIIMLRRILEDIDAIKRNHHSVREEMILKMCGGS
jgi:hypothetical protein